jgi:hypothetical protein
MFTKIGQFGKLNYHLGERGYYHMSPILGSNHSTRPSSGVIRESPEGVREFPEEVGITRTSSSDVTCVSHNVEWWSNLCTPQLISSSLGGLLRSRVVRCHPELSFTTNLDSSCWSVVKMMSVWQSLRMRLTKPMLIILTKSSFSVLAGHVLYPLGCLTHKTLHMCIPRSDNLAYFLDYSWTNEEPAKLNRDVALRAVWPNFLTLFSVNSCPKITHLFWLDFIKTYTTMHQKQNSQYVIGFSYEKSARHRYRQCFLLGKIL